MNKSVFVMDTPERCVECNFCGHEYTGEGMNIECGASYCCLNAHEVKNIESKPDWCPLKPLPERMKVTGIYNGDYFKSGGKPPSYKIGWNACLDEITGEK